MAQYRYEREAEPRRMALPQRERRYVPPRQRHRRRRLRGELYFICTLVVLFTIIFGLCRGIYHALHRESGTRALPAVMDTARQDGGDSDLTDGEKLQAILSDGASYPTDLQELAQKNPETLDYVYNYPTASVAASTGTPMLNEEEIAGGVPLLIQWDSRWGYRQYGTGLIGYTGCGPTCLSMVAVGLTGDSSATPDAVAEYAVQNGYYSSGNGTTWALMSKGCSHFGLTAQELSLSEQRMAGVLADGEAIIASVGPGDFTDTGHFIVIISYSDGAFIVHDPNSIRRSERTWTFDELQGQIKNLWAFSKK